MTTKRGNNEGTIHRLPSGSFRAQVSLNGRRLGHTAKTRKDCADWLRKTLGQIDEGMTYSGTKITLEEFLADWLSSLKTALRPRTWEQYSQLTRAYISHGLGGYRIRDVSADKIQSFYDRLLTKGVGIHTVRKIHAILHNSFERAAKLGIINQNPVSLATQPKLPDEEMNILDENQISQLLIASKDSRLFPLLHLALATGMRQMEILGLKWTDLDWVRQTLKVERQLVRPEVGKVMFVSPKTRAGKRSLPLGSKTIEVLREHSEHQYAERIAAGDRWQENNLIFTSNIGSPIHPRNLLRDFKKLLRTAGLPPIRFHDLRHTAASLMLNNNIPAISVSRRLGHANPSITLNVYGHLLPSTQAEVAEMIDGLITPIQIPLTAVDPSESDLIAKND